MNQKQMIYQYLKDSSDGITPTDAIREFGCLRLAARIADLKKMKIQIYSVWDYSINRYGKKIKFKRYFLKQEDTSNDYQEGSGKED